MLPQAQARMIMSMGNNRFIRIFLCKFTQDFRDNSLVERKYIRDYAFCVRNYTRCAPNYAFHARNYAFHVRDFLWLG